MITVANVKLWGEMVGAVAWNEQTQTADFEYNRAFLAKGLDISPIQMPISFPRIYSFGELSRDTFVGLPGLLADSLDKPLQIDPLSPLQIDPLRRGKLTPFARAN